MRHANSISNKRIDSIQIDLGDSHTIITKGGTYDGQEYFLVTSRTPIGGLNVHTLAMSEKDVRDLIEDMADNQFTHGELHAIKTFFEK